MRKHYLVCPNCKKTNGFKQINSYLFAYCDKHHTKWLVGMASHRKQARSEMVDNDTYLWNYVQVEPSHRNTFINKYQSLAAINLCSDRLSGK